MRVGVDLIEVERIREALQRFGDRFLERVFTPQERAYAQGRVPELAARFAAKEALSKTLGTGIWSPDGVSWLDLEVVRGPAGEPEVLLHGTALERARHLGLERFALSLSHSRQHALAMVVAS